MLSDGQRLAFDVLGVAVEVAQDEQQDEAWLRFIAAEAQRATEQATPADLAQAVALLSSLLAQAWAGAEAGGGVPPRKRLAETVAFWELD